MSIALSSAKSAGDECSHNRLRGIGFGLAGGHEMLLALIPKVGLEPTPSCEDRILRVVPVVTITWFGSAVVEAHLARTIGAMNRKTKPRTLHFPHEIRIR